MAVHVVVPAGIDDPADPSGGNIYDRRLCEGLVALGWVVREHAVTGSWPAPSRFDRDTLARVIAAIPDAAVVLIDGLIASVVPDVLVPHAERLRLVVLVHMPLGNGSSTEVASAEQMSLAAAAAIVTTSRWTRSWLLDTYALAPAAIDVAEPGVDPAALAAGSPAGAALLCVAAVTPTKGHDVLITALSRVTDLAWQCICVGSTDRAPEFVEQLQRRLHRDGLGDRVRFTGPLVGSELVAAYAGADVLVLPSRAETYGMVVTESLARGVPVVATAVGGLPEAMGQDGRGARPGLLVPPDDPAALAAVVRSWLCDCELRDRLRRAARGRRTALTGWADTAATVSRVLARTAP